jgi:hypothetical protein
VRRLQPQLPRDGVRDVLLHGEGLFDGAVVVLSPDSGPFADVDDLGLDHQDVAPKVDASRHDRSHPEPQSHLSGLQVFAPGLEAGSACHDPKTGEARELANEGLGNASGYVLDVWIVADVLEGQYRYRRDRAARRWHSGVPEFPGQPAGRQQRHGRYQQAPAMTFRDADHPSHK